MENGKICQNPLYPGTQNTQPHNIFYNPLTILGFRAGSFYSACYSFALLLRI